MFALFQDGPPATRSVCVLLHTKPWPGYIVEAPIEPELKYEHVCLTFFSKRRVDSTAGHSLTLVAPIIYMTLVAPIIDHPCCPFKMMAGPGNGFMVCHKVRHPFGVLGGQPGYKCAETLYP